MTSNTTIILAGSLIDGTGAPAMKKVLMRIVDGRISSLEPYYRDLGLAPSEIIDLSHCTLLPPLVDSHAHLFMSGTTDAVTRKHQLVAEYHELKPVIRQHLHFLFSHGVLGVRDGGDRGGYALRYRNENEMHPEVKVVAAGRGWHKKGRYGGLIGRNTGEERLHVGFEGDREDSEVVKIVNSGLNSLSVFAKETAPQFLKEELEALVRAAVIQGKKVMVHANGVEPVRMAIEAGCHSIEHGFFMGRKNLELMAERGTVWVPTLFTMKAYRDNLPVGTPGVDHGVLQENIEHQLEQLRLARSLGVNVALGTDAGSLGVLHGESIVEEMRLFKKAGYSLVETIKAASADGAKLLGIDDLGELTPGKEATFLVSRGGPAQLPRKLLYLEDIYTQGSPSEFYRKNPIKHLAP
jgi:imidazolonepropionase-like amidohydrolase